MTIVDSDAAGTAVVSDYLGRLHAAGWGLASARRDELVAEAREHINEALRAEREAGKHGAAVVRNVLERLGPPEEIVRAESEGQPYDVAGAATSGHAPFPSPGSQTGPATAYSRDSLWGPVKIFAVLLLGRQLPAARRRPDRWRRARLGVGSVHPPPEGRRQRARPIARLRALPRPCSRDSDQRKVSVMFDVGPTELLLMGIFPLSGFLAAIYLILALHNKSRRSQHTR